MTSALPGDANPWLTVAGDGVTLCVGVNYEASSPRRIALRFQEAGFSDVHITPLTEAFIAPALLPRGWIQQQILLAIKEVSHLLANVYLVSLSCNVLQPSSHTELELTGEFS